MPVPAVAEALDAAQRPTADRYRWMVESVQEVIFEADPTGAWTYLNPAWTRILGHDIEASLGKPFLDFVHPDDRQGNLEIFMEVITTGKDRCRFEARYLTAEGGVRDMEIHAWIYRDADGAPLGSTGTLTDITDRKRAEAELQRQATTDQLTGLANRAVLAERLAAVVRSGGAALLFLDLDRFKLVNDSLGHDAGDHVLRVVGQRLRTATSSPAAVARFGGDEFVVMAPGLELQEARHLAARLRAAIAAPIDMGGRPLSVSASVGVRLWSPADARGEDAVVVAKALLRDADAAMYEAKQAGRDRTEIFDLATHERIVHRLETEALLRGSGDRGELALHLQPQVNLVSGAVTGAEALLRWHHPVAGLQQPGSFLHVAEDSGLIVPIGRWVLEEAARILVRFAAHELPRLSINISARQLGSGLVADVAATLAMSRIDPTRLCLELTETALLGDNRSDRASMSALGDLGVRLSLDDFGTGYSSLAHLQRLPLHEVKVDRSFVARIHLPEGRAIVSAVLSMADALGLDVVAEGVERRHEAEALVELGCRFAQGWRFGHPVDAANLSDALARANRAALAAAT